jgi:phage gp45-like
MNNFPGMNNNASYSPFKKKKSSPDQQGLSNVDKQIMKAMGHFANVLRNARLEAEEATVNATRKAELEAWLESHTVEIDTHIEVSCNTPSNSRQAQMLERHIGNVTASNEIGGKGKNGNSKKRADRQSRSLGRFSVSV